MSDLDHHSPQRRSPSLINHFRRLIIMLYQIAWARLKQDILRHYIILALNIMILVFLFFHMKTYDADLQQNIRNDVRNLQTENLMLDQYILRMKFNNLANYDVLQDQQLLIAKYLTKIMKHHQALDLPHSSSNDLIKKIKTRLYLTERIVNISGENLEYIKMNHSLVINSNSYFHIQVQDVIREFMKFPEGNPVAMDLALLKEKISNYSAMQTEENYEKAFSHIKSLEKTRNKLKAGDELGKKKVIPHLIQPFSESLRHALIVLTKTKELKTGIEYYYGMPRTENYSKLLQAYDDLFNEKNNFSQKMLVLFYMMLIGSWAHIAYLLFEVLGQNKRIAQQKEELKVALTQQKQLNILQRKFVSMVSHEFRTPLAIIDTSAQKLIRRAQDIAPEKIIDAAETTRKSIKRLLELIESTLNAQRMESGEMEFVPTSCNVGELLQDICNGQTYINSNKKIMTSFSMLPAEIYADPKLLNHVFTNLISNAIKYSPEASEIDVKAHRLGDEIIVKVRDRGVGIPQDELPNLFTCFYRASTSTGIPGTGIGLHLVKTIIDRHGGRMEVQSTVGEGSEFTVILPVRDVPVSADALEGYEPKIAALG